MTNNEMIEWNAAQEANRLLIHLSAKAAEKRALLNEALNYKELASRLEDWYERIDSMYNRIYWFLAEEELKIADKIKKEIEDITQGQLFRDAPLEPNKLYDLRKKIDHFENRIHFFMGRHGLMGAKKSVMQYDSVFDQIEDES